MTTTRHEFSTSIPGLMRRIARHAAEECNREAAQAAYVYGVSVETDKFVMRETCVCMGHGCAYCMECDDGLPPPNFEYAPMGLKVWWSKKIGAGMAVNRCLTQEEIAWVELGCLATLGKL